MKENLTSKTGHFHFAKSGHYHVAGTHNLIFHDSTIVVKGVKSLILNSCKKAEQSSDSAKPFIQD
jgi:hypothetical protein